MRYLVTGGAGFIGSHLVSRLLAPPSCSVCVLDNESRGRFPDIPRPNMDCVHGDVRAFNDVLRAMRRCDVVFHLAAASSVMGCEDRPQEAHDTNVTGTFNVFRAARELGVRRVVMASSREVYGEVSELPVKESAAINPKNVYGTTKAAGELYCSWAAASIPTTVLRLSNVYGPGDTDRVIPRFIDAARKNQTLTVYGGSQVIDFVFIDLVVDVFVQAGLGPCLGGVLNVGSGVGTTVLETARQVIHQFQSSSELNVVASRDADVSRFVADVSQLQSKLGFRIADNPLKELARMDFAASTSFHEARASRIG